MSNYYMDKFYSFVRFTTIIVFLSILKQIQFLCCITPFGKYDSKIIEKIGQLIFEEFAKTNNYDLIFTFMWAFDQQEDWDYIKIDNTDLSAEAVANIIKEKYFL